MLHEVNNMLTHRQQRRLFCPASCDAEKFRRQACMKKCTAGIIRHGGFFSIASNGEKAGGVGHGE